MEIVNVLTGDWDDDAERGSFHIRERQIGERIGARLLGGSVYEVAPGKKLWPYHLHHANEEWLLVLRGRPTLRTPDGERELTEGDAACFPRGVAGAHQVRNDTDEPARILMLSSQLAPDILEYPDTGKTALVDAKGEQFALTHRGEPAGYWDDET
jgi:uncharacterized cupin superfamily protein